MADGVQKRLQNEVEKYQNSQKDLQKYVSARQRLDAQLSENMLVKQELDGLEAKADVYKLIGPILVKQDLEEGKQTVQKRIDYINGEIKRHDGIIKEMEKKQDSQRETLAKLQHQFQQAQVKAAARS